MRILLIGYGKMGQAIAKVAKQRGHHIVHKIHLVNRESLTTVDPETVDIALEFSQPMAAYDNIVQCLSKNIPVVSGTTGWIDKKRKQLYQYCEARKGTFFYAANFSIGMHIFFKVNTLLAKLMNHYTEYNVTLEETHHVAKKDVPSGTAIALAKAIIQNIDHKKDWELTAIQKKAVLPIIAKREQDVPGTHAVTYKGPLDTLEIKHTAHSREGFALGAILVAEWIQDQQGILGMEDFLKLADC